MSRGEESYESHLTLRSASSAPEGRRSLTCRIEPPQSSMQVRATMARLKLVKRRFRFTSERSE